MTASAARVAARHLAALRWERSELGGSLKYEASGRLRVIDGKTLKMSLKPVLFQITRDERHPSKWNGYIRTSHGFIVAEYDYQDSFRSLRDGQRKLWQESQVFWAHTRNGYEPLYKGDLQERIERGESVW